MIPLHPCPSCHRHTRIDEGECPFCSGKLVPDVARRQYRLRQAQVVLSSALAAAMLGCGGPAAESEHPNGAVGRDKPGDAGITEAGAQQRVSMTDAGSGDAGSQSAADPDGGSPEPNIVAVYADTTVTFLVAVHFKLHSTKPTGDSRSIIDAAADAMGHLSRIQVLEIRGYADPTEGKAAERLAEARAQAVRDELVKLGVEPERLRIAGYGASKPVAKDNQHEANARVEFKVVEMGE
jgi:outer membrane protein OmpA-like peptidoglycan-associated protein